MKNTMIRLCAVLLLCIPAFGQTSQPIQLQPAATAPASAPAALDAYTLTGPALSVAVDRTTGQIVELIDRQSSRDFCRLDDRRFGMIGGLRVTDMLSGKEYDDFGTASTATLVERNEDGTRLVLDKRFDGADFVLRLSFTLDDTCLQWDVFARKTAGPDRQIRLTYLLPLPYMNAWAPMNEPTTRLRWEEPYQVRHGLAYGRSVQHEHRTALIPMVTLSDRSRCVAYAVPPDVPNVCIRFMNSADEDSLFLLNSIREYPISQRPHFRVVNDFLSLREGKETRFSLLVSPNKGKWRDALGWYATRYSEYFQPDPKVRSHDGVYSITVPWDQNPDESLAEKRLEGRAARGVKWMELHGHFPWYGLYVHPEPEWQGSWGPMSYEKTNRYIDLVKKHGIAVHIYYNIIDGQIKYVDEHFPESVARDEDGQIIRAYTDCHLMNADLSTPFGKHCFEQFEKLLSTYPNIDGIFFDVYGRHYDIDFGHDDGLTMVNNKPAYCLKFAFQRLMEKIDPLARAKGLVFSANKPEGIEFMRGIDYIMADEGSDEDRLAAMQYYGLFKPIIILDGGIATRAEGDFKKCLQYGMIYNDLDPDREMKTKEATPEMLAQAANALEAYGPLFDLLVGRTWVLSGDPVELPEGIRGNIFRRPNGDYIVTLVNDDRSIFDDLPARRNVKITVRVPDMDKYTKAEIHSADYEGVKLATIDRGGQRATATGPDSEKWKEEEAKVEASPRRRGRGGRASSEPSLVITLPEHRTASVVVLKRSVE
jgi:hypothetical protein